MSALPNCAVKGNMLLLVIFIQMLGCYSLTIKRIEENIITKSRIQLNPLEISCDLNNIIKISAPVINEHSVYRLHKPNGNVIRLQLPKQTNHRQTYHGDMVVIKKVNNTKPILRQFHHHSTFALNHYDIDSEEKNMDNNEFMIGPLQTEDGGNWVLSVYTKDLDDNWIELFQVITLIITETIELNAFKATLYAGDTFNLSFAYPIPNIESCELIAPKSTFDRYYTRKDIFQQTCAYSVTNITKQDQGKWSIQGVTTNKIVYQGTIELEVKERQKSKWDRRKRYRYLMKKYRHILSHGKVVRGYK